MTTTVGRDPADPIRRQWIPVLVAIAIAGVLVVRGLSQAEWDPTLFTAFGEEATPTRQYAEKRLGDIYLRPAQGHDGRFFFVQANDPWLLTPEANAVVLDRPAYRSQRMLYPLVASGFGALGPEQIVWGLIIVNVIAMGLGSWAVAAIANSMGMSSWWGLAFVLNVGFISELNIDGAGILAAAAALGAVASLLRGRLLWATILLAAASLSREVMLVTVAGVAWWLWHTRKQKRQAVLVLLPSALTVLVWAAYLRLGVGLQAVSEVQEIGPPFLGIIQAFSSWRHDPLDLVVGITVIALLVLFTRRAFLHDRLIVWAFIGFVPVCILLTEQVWRSYFDITRAIAPLTTAYILLVGLGDRPSSDETPKSAGDSLVPSASR